MSSQEYLDSIAQFEVPGKRPFAGFAESAISAVNSDIWGGFAATAIQPDPVLNGYTIYLKSSSNSDAAAGTGAQTVMFDYIKVGGERAMSDLYSPTGITEAATGVTDCVFINNMFVVDVGTNKVAVGDVDALIGPGGVVAHRIQAAGNFALSTMKMVPVGERLTIEDWAAEGTSSTSKEATIRIRATCYETPTGYVKNPGVYHFKDVCRVKDGPVGHRPIDVPIVIPEMTPVKISGWPTGGVTVAASWRGYLETIS
jgi:hypothetical protein